MKDVLNTIKEYLRIIVPLTLIAGIGYLLMKAQSVGSVLYSAGALMFIGPILILILAIFLSKNVVLICLLIAALIFVPFDDSPSRVINKVSGNHSGSSAVADTYTYDSTGFDLREKWDNDTSALCYVYITPSGKCYHELNCSYLDDTEYVKPYVINEVPNEYDACSICITDNEGVTDAIVYFMSDGTEYHTNKRCKYIANESEVMKSSLADVDRLEPCTNCVPFGE